MKRITINKTDMDYFNGSKLKVDNYWWDLYGDKMDKPSHNQHVR